MKVVFLNALQKKADEGGDENDEVDFDEIDIPDEEVMLVDQFLTKFTILSESSMNEHLDIMLMLKALPNKIMDYTLEEIEQFSFRVF